MFELKRGRLARTGDERVGVEDVVVGKKDLIELKDLLLWRSSTRRIIFPGLLVLSRTARRSPDIEVNSCVLLAVSASSNRCFPRSTTVSMSAIQLCVIYKDGQGFTVIPIRSDKE